MSRIGNMPIIIPSGVTAEIKGHHLVISGPLGKLEMEVDSRLKVELEDQKLLVKRSSEDKEIRSMHGLTRSLLSNMVVGVEKGWQKKLELVGVGFRASGGGEKLILAVGYSHSVEILAPEGVKFTVEENTKVTVVGINKDVVGQVAARVRQVRPPEPYQGKGIRYAGEYVKRKAGKAAKVGGTK